MQNLRQNEDGRDGTRKKTMTGYLNDGLMHVVKYIANATTVNCAIIARIWRIG